MVREIPDAIPEGYINFVEAWEIFNKRDNQTHNPIEKELVTAFANGELDKLSAGFSLS